MLGPAVRCRSRGWMLRRPGKRRNRSDGVLYGRRWAAAKRSGLEDGEDLSFGDHVIETDEYRFELARGR